MVNVGFENDREVNNIDQRPTKRYYNIFALKRNFSLNKARKEKKNCGKFGSMPTFRRTRKGKIFFL